MDMNSIAAAAPVGMTLLEFRPRPAETPSNHYSCYFKSIVLIYQNNKSESPNFVKREREPFAQVFGPNASTAQAR
jgi:hypothetical protein